MRRSSRHTLTARVWRKGKVRAPSNPGSSDSTRATSLTASTAHPTLPRQAISGKDAGPHLLNYLRKHGNYLTPGGGINILSGISVGIRAIFVNLFVWMPLITAVFLLLYWLARILVPY